MYRRHTPRLAAISLLLVLSLFGCPKSSESATQKAAAPKPVTPPPAPAPDAKAKQVFTSFPAISVEGLTPEQVTTFTKFANEEICPCNCPKTFAGCLQSANHCKPAQILGQWIVDRIREGVPTELMLEPLSKEIGEGYEASPQIIDIAGYFGKGAEKPKFTIVEFADFDCAHCKATAGVLDDFVKKYGDKVRLIYKYLPGSSPAGELAAVAAEAAGRQNKFWQMHDAAFRTQTLLSEELLLGHAKAIGLNMEKFKKDLNDKELRLKVERSKQEAIKLGLVGTPSIFFNGRPYHLSLNMSGFDMRLAMELARSDSTCN